MGSGKHEAKRSCHHDYFTKWDWLHYSLEKDSLFCYPCNQAFVQNKLVTNMFQKTFISGNGFSKWNKATELINKHQSSDCHRESVKKMCETGNEKQDIGKKISNEYREKEEQNQRCFLIIIEYIRVFARQGLALRGDQTEGNQSDGDHVAEFNSNFHQFLLVEAKRNPDFALWMKKKTDKFTSPTMQNEIIEIIAMEILRDVVGDIKSANFYSIMADESCDVSNTEQLSFGVRYVKNFEAFECFVGLHEVENTSADHVVKAMKLILIACDFDFSKIRGQCYDGASSMSGYKTGVKTQILSENKKALYIHCYNHALNLSVMDTLNKIKLFKDTMSFCEELLILFKKSPKRATLLKKLKLETFDDTPGLISFAKTRWTVKGASLNSIILNYRAVYKVLKDSFQKEKVTEMKSRINGVLFQMKNFNFYFGIALAKEILFITDNLAKLLQRKDLSAAEGKELYKITAKALETMKSEEFENFWKNTVKQSEDLGVEVPKLKRKSKKPERYLDSSDEEEDFPENPKEHYKSIFMQAFGLILECLKSRFEQESLKMYENLQNLLVLAANKEDYNEVLDEILEFYGDDFDEENLRAQMKIFKTMFSEKTNVTYADIMAYFRQLGPYVQVLIGEVCKVVELMLVLPASNATIERSFSKMKNIKTRLRSSMSSKRLNHFMICAHYTEMVDKLDNKKIAEVFRNKDSRRKVFGKNEF